MKGLVKQKWENLREGLDPETEEDRIQDGGWGRGMSWSWEVGRVCSKNLTWPRKKSELCPQLLGGGP